MTGEANEMTDNEKAGEIAFARGLGMGENPYQSNDVRYDYWENGWQQAQIAAEKSA